MRLRWIQYVKLKMKSIFNYFFKKWLVQIGAKMVLEKPHATHIQISQDAPKSKLGRNHHFPPLIWTRFEPLNLVPKICGIVGLQIPKWEPI